MGEQMIVSSDVLKGKKVEFARQDLDSVRVTLKRKEKDKDQYLAIPDLIEFEPSFYTLLYELICLMDIRDLKGIINLSRPFADETLFVFKRWILTREGGFNMRAKHTLNLGKTKFPKRGRLPETEPQREALWEENKVYEQRQKLNE
ncbi:UNVERIFIED_CONTAM: hypothetical protein DV033_11520, partial [Limosilactobacillus fermentum]|nr:hypothetical protein [Limosilactobacillus fermentum]